MQCHICEVVVFSFILIKYNLCIYVLCIINKLFGYPSCQWGITGNEILRNVRRVTRIVTCISPSHHALHNMEVLWDQDDKPGLCICRWNICLPVVVDSLLAHCQCLHSLCHHHRWSWIKLYIRKLKFWRSGRKIFLFYCKVCNNGWLEERKFALFLWLCLRSVTLLKLPQTDIHNTEYVCTWLGRGSEHRWLVKQNLV